MSTVLVAGVNGFVGKHLLNALKDANHSVIGVGMEQSPAESIQAQLDGYHSCDLTNLEAVKALPLGAVDAVINLAGLAQVGASFGQAEKYLHINVAVHTTIAEVCLKTGSSPRLVSISTGAVYDNSQPMPLNESSALIKTGSPYALSKIAMEQAMLDYVDKGLSVVLVRPFNHIGPGQLPGFLVPDLYEKMKAGSEITVGNLETKRDYTDVRDVVRAYTMLATHDTLQQSVYNVCSGRSISGQVIFETLRTASNRPEVTARVDQTLIRPDDPMDIIGDNSRIQEELDWTPAIPLEQTIRDFVAWRDSQA